MKAMNLWVAGLVSLPFAAQAQTEISWWHAMSGANSEVVEKIASDFNASQTDYVVKPVFKGTYPETLNAGIAAFRAGQAPDIMQVFDVGTGVMMGAQGAIKPVAEVMSKQLTTVPSTTPIADLIPIYARGWVPIVVDNGDFVGLATKIDVLNYLRRRMS